MTGLLVHGGDVQGALVVLVILVAILACGYGEDLAHHLRTRKTTSYGAYVDRVVNTARLGGVIDLDHAACEGTDCDQIICCCPDGLCPGGFVAQACDHHNLLCDECRYDCTDCLQAARDDAGVTW